MGWIGAGLVLAATAYFLYRYPLRSWAEPRSFAPPEPTAPPEPKPTGPVTPTTPDEPVQERHDSRVSAPVELDEDSQSTPKAPTSNAPIPVLTVPELSLNSDTATMPAISQPPIAATNNSSQKDRSNEAHKSLVQPPSFAAPPQPMQSSTTRPAPPSSSSSLMPPPPIPRPTPQPNRLAPKSTLQPPRLSGASFGPPPSAAASQRGPPITSTRQINSTLAPTPVTLQKSSKKVVLEPGFSPLDWAALAANPKSKLRGENLPPGLLRVTPSMLKEQHGRKGRDAWTSYRGKVYNISPYAPYHPGGKGELLRGAGKDSAQLFQEVHPWVNWEGILGECLVGILVSENDLRAENTLDAMD
ncbi:uncharacterized protein N7529_005584 [Penicillium soppii]|jgi:cytochrome b involved in lipid metabolism|uniref:uncharacterized protein n=1 Tax=Penicillium soppii TaxID=69789 RepID=UPI002546AF19|nr:uncharacterized protein N7529_005584 [Penicillium soppii]KAJ5863668.1 hypothetical protein N7529_005584 [Penicillium soppii]